jgi:hypothetical protein
MPADSALRREPTPVGEAPVSPVAEPPIGWLVCDLSCAEAAFIEVLPKLSFCILLGLVTSISQAQFASEHL